MPTLNWRGKDAVLNHHLDVPYHLLKCEPELSAGCPGSGNLIVEGDNLRALKALLPYYKGQVHCVYIDPPYNTGDENWVYNDNVNSPEIRDWLGKVVGKEAEDLNRHDKWLCMMWPRLLLLKQFLTEDGIILVSIDDNEVCRLRILLDDVFGATNFIAQLVWEKGRKNDATHVSSGHEYMFVYCKSKPSIKDTKWRIAKDGIDEIADEYNSLKLKHGTDYSAITKGLSQFYKNLPKDHPSKKYARAKNADIRGVWRDNNIAWHGGGGPKYDIIHPVTNKPCVVPEDGWRFIEETMKQKIADGWVIFRKDHTKPPIYKSYIYLEGGESHSECEENEGQKEVLPSVFYRHTQPANDVQKAIFGKKVFENPKDHEVIKKWIKYVTNGNKNAIIMDSFAGSGTTGHSVLSLNASDGGNRRFILIEMDPSISQTITTERIRKVISGYSMQKQKQIPGTGGSFRYCKLGEKLFHGNGSLNEELTRDTLARHLFFTEFGEPLTANPPVGNSLVGTFGETALHLLWNTNGPGFLDAAALRGLPDWDGEFVVYGEGCAIPSSVLQDRRISFRQIPYRVRG